MSLRSDIDATLEASTEFAYSNFGAPILSGLPATPAVMTRYGGMQVVNGFLRHVIEVVMVYNVATRTDAYDGLEDAVNALIDALNGVSDCYPELLSVGAVHDYKVTKVTKDGQLYVGAIVPCVGA